MRIGRPSFDAGCILKGAGPVDLPVRAIGEINKCYLLHRMGRLVAPLEHVTLRQHVTPRRLRQLLGLMLSLALAVLTTASAQQTDLNAILKAFNEYRSQGNYPAALVEAQK